MTKKRRGTLSASLARVLSQLATQNRVVFNVNEFAKAGHFTPQQVWTALNFLTDGCPSRKVGAALIDSG